MTPGRRGVALCALLLVAAYLAALGGTASLSGAWDKRAFGCTCHSPTATSTLVLEVTGFPDRYALGSSYHVEVRVVSTPVNMSGPYRAGFNAEVSQGTLAVPVGAENATQTFANQATHRLASTNLTNWSFTWRAPASPSGVVTLWVTVNTVNGNGAPDTGDEWAQVRQESVGPSPNTGGGGGGGPLAQGPAAWALIAGALAAGAVAFVVIQRRWHGRGGRAAKVRRGPERTRPRRKRRRR